MSKEEIFVSIVIPAYKEERRIANILSAIEAYQKCNNFQIETLVVIDASPDNTKKAALEYQNRIRNLRIIDNKKHLGKGGVVRQGMLEASGQYILFSDADNATPIGELDKLLPYVDKFEVIIGSRYCEGGKFVVPQPLYRRIGSRFINLIVRSITGLKISDTQCGFKLFEQRVAKKIFTNEITNGFSFDIEVLMIAKHLGYRIKEVGVNWFDNPHSTVNPIKDGIRFIISAVKLRGKVAKIKR